MPRLIPLVPLIAAAVFSFASAGLAQYGPAGGGADAAPPPPPFGIGVRADAALPGWRVTEVTRDSPADRAGVRVDDVIVDAKDAGGRGVAIQPSLGFDPLRGVLKGNKFSLIILRQNAQPPLMEVKVERPTKAPAPAKAEDATQRADAGPAETIVLTRKTLTDPGMGNMPSHTLLAPKGWQVKGGAWWAPPGYTAMAPSQDITLTAPDGRSVRVMPGLTAKDIQPGPQMRQMGLRRPAEGTADEGNLILYMPADLDEWKEWMRTKSIPAKESGAEDFRVNSVTVIPELTAVIRKSLEQNRQMMQQVNPQTAVDGAFLAFDCSYTKDGREWQVGVLLSTGYIISGDGMGGQSTIWWIDLATAFTAPAGELEANVPLMMAVLNSVQPTPQWAKMKAEHLAKMNGIVSKGIAERGRTAREGARDVARINQAGRDRRDASDRGQEGVVNMIRGTEDYITPGGGEAVQLPANYGHVYTNGNGEYLLTNDSLYNPNTDAAVNGRTWETMEAKP